MHNSPNPAAASPPQTPEKKKSSPVAAPSAASPKKLQGLMESTHARVKAKKREEFDMINQLIEKLEIAASPKKNDIELKNKIAQLNAKKRERMREYKEAEFRFREYESLKKKKHKVSDLEKIVDQYMSYVNVHILAKKLITESEVKAELEKTLGNTISARSKFSRKQKEEDAKEEEENEEEDDEDEDEDEDEDDEFNNIITDVFSKIFFNFSKKSIEYLKINYGSCIPDNFLEMKDDEIIKIATEICINELLKVKISFPEKMSLTPTELKEAIKNYIEAFMQIDELYAKHLEYIKSKEKILDNLFKNRKKIDNLKNIFKKNISPELIKKITEFLETDSAEQKESDDIHEKIVRKIFQYILEIQDDDNEFLKIIKFAKENNIPGHTSFLIDVRHEENEQFFWFIAAILSQKACSSDPSIQEAAKTIESSQKMFPNSPLLKTLSEKIGREQKADALDESGQSSFAVYQPIFVSLDIAIKKSSDLKPSQQGKLTKILNKDIVLSFLEITQEAEEKEIRKELLKTGEKEVFSDEDIQNMARKRAKEEITQIIKQTSPKKDLTADNEEKEKKQDSSKKNDSEKNISPEPVLGKLEESLDEILQEEAEDDSDNDEEEQEEEKEQEEEEQEEEKQAETDENPISKLIEIFFNQSYDDLTPETKEEKQKTMEKFKKIWEKQQLWANHIFNNDHKHNEFIFNRHPNARLLAQRYKEEFLESEKNKQFSTLEKIIKKVKNICEEKFTIIEKFNSEINEFQKLVEELYQVKFDENGDTTDDPTIKRTTPQPKNHPFDQKESNSEGQKSPKKNFDQKSLFSETETETETDPNSSSIFLKKHPDKKPDGIMEENVPKKDIEFEFELELNAEAESEINFENHVSPQNFLDLAISKTLFLEEDVQEIKAIQEQTPSLFSEEVDDSSTNHWGISGNPSEKNDEQDADPEKDNIWGFASAEKNEENKSIIQSFVSQNEGTLNNQEEKKNEQHTKKPSSIFRQKEEEKEEVANVDDVEDKSSFDDLLEEIDELLDSTTSQTEDSEMEEKEEDDFFDEESIRQAQAFLRRPAPASAEPKPAPIPTIEDVKKMNAPILEKAKREQELKISRDLTDRDALNQLIKDLKEEPEIRSINDKAKQIRFILENQQEKLYRNVPPSKTALKMNIEEVENTLIEIKEIVFKKRFGMNLSQNFEAKTFLKIMQNRFSKIHHDQVTIDKTKETLTMFSEHKTFIHNEQYGIAVKAYDDIIQETQKTRTNSVLHTVPEGKHRVQSQPLERKRSIPNIEIRPEPPKKGAFSSLMETIKSWFWSSTPPRTNPQQTLPVSKNRFSFFASKSVAISRNSPSSAPTHRA